MIDSLSGASRAPAVGSSKPRLFRLLGPGLVTGASDDDPSGIATYTQTGAQFGYGVAWTLLFSYPLMAAIQIISAQIGRTTGAGIAGNLRGFYPNWIVRSAILLLLVANTINLGADIGAMGAAVRVLVGGPQIAYVFAFGALCAVLQIFLVYKRYVAVLKWLTLALFAYVATLLFVKIDWRALSIGLFVPRLSTGTDYLTAIVAIFGTTISPVSLLLAVVAGSRGYEDDAEAKAAEAGARTGARRAEPDSARHIARHGLLERHRARDHGDGRSDAQRRGREERAERRRCSARP